MTAGLVASSQQADPESNVSGAAEVQALEQPLMEGAWEQVLDLDGHAEKALVISLASTAQVLGPTDTKAADGTRMQATAASSCIDQRFAFFRNGDGSYRIVNPKSKLALTVGEPASADEIAANPVGEAVHPDDAAAPETPGSGIEPSASSVESAVYGPVELRSYTGEAAQKWTVTPQDGEEGAQGLFTISLQSDPQAVLHALELPSGRTLIVVSDATGEDAPDASPAANASPAAFALWAPRPTIPDGVYLMWNKHEPLFALGIKDGLLEPGSALIADKRKDNAAHRFKLTWEDQFGYYTICNADNGLALAVCDASDTDGAAVQLAKTTSAYAQRWMVVHAPDGQGYYLKSCIGGKVLWGASACAQAVKDAEDAASDEGGIQPASEPEEGEAPWDPDLDPNPAPSPGSLLQLDEQVVVACFQNLDSQAWTLRHAAAPSTSANSGKLHIKGNWYEDDDEFEAYHPKVVAFDKPWNGYRYWMAYTPYPKGDATYEDPCIAASNDMLNWEYPEGLVNPIHDTHDDGSYAKHNSDAHLLFNPDTGQLELFWRWIDSTSAIIYRATSDDGVTWSDREIAYYCPDRNNADECISPAIVYEDGLYRMWFVGSQAGNVLYSESRYDGGFDWSTPQPIDFGYRQSEIKTWHLDVERTDQGYEAVMAAYDEWSNRNRMCLWYSCSDDGLDGWSTPRIVLEPATNATSPKDGSGRWDNMGIYRSCLLKVDGVYYIFYGGTSTDYHHGIGLVYGRDLDHLVRNDVDFGNPDEVGQFAPLVVAGTQVAGEFVEFPTSIADAVVTTAKVEYDYNGTALEPKVKVVNGSRKLVVKQDYEVSYSKNVKAGTATVTVQGIGLFTGKAKTTFGIAKAKQSMSVKASKGVIDLKSAKRLKSKKRLRLLNVSKAKGAVSYELVSVDRPVARGKISVKSSSGKIVLAKGLRAGTYRVKVRVRAEGDRNYKPASKTKTVTIVVGRPS